MHKKKQMFVQTIITHYFSLFKFSVLIFVLLVVKYIYYILVMLCYYKFSSLTIEPTE